MKKAEREYETAGVPEQILPAGAMATAKFSPSEGFDPSATFGGGAGQGPGSTDVVVRGATHPLRQAFTVLPAAATL